MGDTQVSQSVLFREATRADLPGILRLLAQPEMDDGHVLSLAAAERLFDRMARYPDYRIHVAIRDDRIVGSFALLNARAKASARR